MTLKKLDKSVRRKRAAREAAAEKRRQEILEAREAKAAQEKRQKLIEERAKAREEKLKARQETKDRNPSFDGDEKNKEENNKYLVNDKLSYKH